MNNSVSQELLKFLQKSPTAFHAVQQMKSELLAVDFTELKENQCWNIECGKHYLVTRNDSSLIAFTIPENGIDKMHILTSHSDSPTFKIKENPEIEVEKHYVKLNVEKYGGMLCAPWFDRPLSVAGRVIIKDKTNGQFTSKLVNIDRDLVMIPNLAIHMNREINSGYNYNAQKDLLPLYGCGSPKGTFMEQIAEAAGVEKMKFSVMIYSFITDRKVPSGGLPKSSSPVAGLMTCSVPSHHFKVFFPVRKKTVWLYTVFWIMKKLEAVRNRAPHPRSFLTH